MYLKNIKTMQSELYQRCTIDVTDRTSHNGTEILDQRARNGNVFANRKGLVTDRDFSINIKL